MLTKEVIEPKHPSFELVKSYQHDAYGNIQISTISGVDIKSRSHRTDYDDKGRYVITSENALGHTEAKTYRMGNLESLKGPNGLTTRWEYDGFGRTTLETRADGTQTRTAYLLCDATCPSNGKYFVRTETSGAASTLTYYDKLDREIRRQTTGFDGRAIYIDQLYNERGEVTQVSEPYFADETPLWTINEYDAISRPVKETAPGDRISTTDYQALTTIVTNALGQTNTRTINVLGQLIKSIDNLNNAITYIYDGFGNLIELRDPANNVTKMQYDIRGNKTSMYDADTGQTKYTYNALDELISQTDANAQTVTMEYDKLGRLFYRQDKDGPGEWTYDTEPKGIGKLAMVKGSNGYKETYRYDSFGRLVETETVLWDELGEQSYFISKTYDQYGRADTLTYPTGFAIQNTYNEHGYLAKVQRVSDNTLYWQTERMNARGQLEQLTLGNGFSTDKVYEQLTGRLQSIKTGDGTIQSLGFHFDQLGNLTERTNSNLSETFQYDDLNRLTETKVDQYSTSIQYDKLGNITYKSDVGNYTYGTKPHAVISVNGVINTQYSYDANGNRTSANGQQIKYTSFNKPRHISQGDNLLEFQYGPTYHRYEQKVTRNGLLSTTNYIGGGIFEREVSQDWEKHTHYIFAVGESVAIYIDKNHGVEQETHYLHKDHLGSIDTITNEQGGIVKQFSFDAWGKRRDPKWGALTEEDLLALLDEDLTTERGFTGHEHLDEVQLIHMNGRVYDPVIGRFLSADPIVQAPTFSQSLNRYSYVMNNPLSLVDPSGFSWWSKKVKPAFKKYGKPVVAVAVGIALGAVTGGLASGFIGAVWSGAGFGFGSAFTGTLLYGGDIKDAFKAGLKGAVIGGVTAGLTYGVGSFFEAGGMGTQMVTTQAQKKEGHFNQI